MSLTAVTLKFIMSRLVEKCKTTTTAKAKAIYTQKFIG